MPVERGNQMVAIGGLGRIRAIEPEALPFQREPVS
jgi:hypothetical protein